MGFKDDLNKILNLFVSEMGFKYIEKSIENEVLLDEYRGVVNAEKARLKDLSKMEAFSEKYINDLSNELFWLLRNEFVHNASNMKVAQGFSVEDRIRTALKGVDVDMICDVHDSITCRLCFGQSYENVPSGRTATEFKKVNTELHGCYSNSWEEQQFLKERISEIKTGESVVNPFVLNPEFRIRGQYVSFINEHRFQYNNKRGFEGEILVAQYIRSFVTDVYFNNEDFEQKRLNLSIEIETLYGRMFSYWIEYVNRQRGVRVAPVRRQLENMSEDTKINQLLEKQYADKANR